MVRLQMLNIQDRGEENAKQNCTHVLSLSANADMERFRFSDLGYGCSDYANRAAPLRESQPWDSICCMIELSFL